jgi:TonB family protein
MIGSPADRKRRTAVAGGVIALHALVLCGALLARADRTRDTADIPVIVTTMFDLPRVQAALPAQTQPSRPRLQEFALRLQEIPEPPVIETPAEIAPIAPVADDSPVIADSASRTDAQVSGDAGNSSGQSGGNGLVLLQRVLPAYPRAAARRGERGTTQVLLHVTQGGRVDQVKVERGSGSKLLDEAAVEAFRKWRFKRLPDSAANGRWLRTAQRFILYQFTYSRLADDAMEYVYGENLKPKAGALEQPTPGGREALLRFLEQLRSQTFDARGGASARDLALLRENLGKWGAAKSVAFTGIVGSERWLRHGTRMQAGRVRDIVEVSWNTFDVRHESATSEWLIAMDHNGEIWAAQVARPPE